MAVQQNKASKADLRSKKAANRYKGVETNVCPSCGGSRRPHRVCAHCGNYNQRQVITVGAAE